MVCCDDSLVVSWLPVAVEPATVTERVVRGWRKVDRCELCCILEDSELSRPPPEDADVDQLFATYDAVLCGISDRLASPHRVRRRRGCLSSWFDAKCRSTRRECRRLERRYRKTRSANDRQQWIRTTLRRFDLHRQKEAYWQQRLMGGGRSPSSLWRSLSPLLGRDRLTSCATDHTANGYATFFARTIDAVRSDTSGLLPPPVFASATSSLASFRPCSESEVRWLIMSSPVKSSSLDPMPTFLVREFNILLPYITKMVNSSLAAGRLPTSQKHAIVTPLLKRSGLDTADMGNYRLVSNLSFMSNVVERAVASRLNDYLAANDLLPRCQSAYRRWHSTETAMLRVCSDFLKAADTRRVTLLSLLDMSAAYDCVDHSILMQRLQSTVWCLTGSNRSCPTVLGRFPTMVNYRRCWKFFSECPKGLC